MIGKTIGHYEILEHIGQGGMGEVYLAQDTSLERKVALKFLPEVLQQDAIAPQRFLREAKAAAALDHPFICHIHEIGEEEGRAFIAMEYVEGETLEARLKKERPSYREVLRIGSEIAEALQRAHQHGIVHRDLKPSNIMLTPEGRVKVMDFGLAKKVVAEDGTEQDITAGLTKEGTTLGTLAYMSPEQLRGEKVDARSDIFSLGVLLFEMLTGQHPFRRAKPMETSAAILAEEPAFPTGSQAGQGITLHPLIQRALAKDPARRVQTIEEVYSTLHQLLEESTPAHWTRKWQYWAALAAGAILVALFLIYLTFPASTPRITNKQKLTDDGLEKGFHWITADERSVYYSQVDRPMNPSIGTVEQILVDGGESRTINPWPGEDRRTLVLEISPDFTELLVISSRQDDRGSVYGDGDPLWILSLPIGTPRRVGSIRANGACWSPDGEQIAYSTNKDIFIVGRDGKHPEKLLSAESSAFVSSWSGKTICYLVYYWGRDRRVLHTVSEDGTNPRELIPKGEGLVQTVAGQWTPKGDFLIFRGSKGFTYDLWALPMKWDVFGFGQVEPVNLTLESLDYRGFAFSPEGNRLFAMITPFEGELVQYREEIDNWVRHSSFAVQNASFLDFSSDGEWAVFMKYPGWTLWKSRSDGSQEMQLTEMSLAVPEIPQLAAAYPKWSPDGGQIAFTATPGVLYNDARVFVIKADGGGLRRVISEEYDQFNASWSPKGKLAVSCAQGRQQPLRIVDIETGKFEDIPNSEGMWECAWSPDGRYIATHGPRSNKIVLFDCEKEEWKNLEKCVGSNLQWSPDSRYLYFSAGPTALFRLNIGAEVKEKVASFEPLGRPPLFVGRWFTFDPDGALITLRNLGNTEIFALDLELP